MDAVEGMEKLLERMTFSARYFSMPLQLYQWLTSLSLLAVHDSKGEEDSKHGLPDEGACQCYLGPPTV